MKKWVIFFISLVNIGCIKDKRSITDVIISNATIHKVTLVPYLNGFVDSSKYKILQAKSSISIENNFQKGKTKIPVVFWDYFKNLDSLVVIWDDIYSMTHMLSDTFTSSNNHLQGYESRNIGLSTSYVNSVKTESKHSIEWAVINTLAEQDYLDAKN